MAYLNFKEVKLIKKSVKVIPQELGADEFINIKPSSEFIPEWYRLSSTTMSGHTTSLNPKQPFSTTSTYKKCSPFLDAITSGYTMYLSADIEVMKKPDGFPYVMWRTERPIITEHSAEQWDGVPVPSGYSPFVYKWHNQHGLKTEKDYSLLFTSPINRFDLPFLTLTGIVDTDLFNTAVHFPFFIKEDFVGIIEKGTPIAQIIPIKREPWEITALKYDPKDSYIKKEIFLSTIKRSYKTNFWHKKEYK
jgi:hypothetical protein